MGNTAFSDVQYYNFYSKLVKKYQTQRRALLAVEVISAIFF